jgi:rhomboid protease GluP
MSRRSPSTPATFGIFAAILIGFGIEILTGAWRNGNVLAKLGAIVPGLIRYEHEYWRLITAMFLHGDGTVRGTLLHLGFNLLALWQIGRLYEMMFGTKRFLLIYFAAGLVASITSYLSLPMNHSSVGASGALFGIFGAFFFSIRRSPRFRNERWAQSIVQQLLFWLVANLVIGFTIPQIDMGAHIGGLVAGLILGAILPHKQPPMPPSQAVIDVTPTSSFAAPGADPEERRDGH